MKLLYKDVAKERGYNKLNRLHYELIEDLGKPFTYES